MSKKNKILKERQKQAKKQAKQEAKERKQREKREQQGPKTYFFRSEPMSKCELTLYAETAFPSLLALGNLGKVQILQPDISTPHNPNFHSIQRCAALKDQIAFIDQQLQAAKIQPLFIPNIDKDHPPRESDLYRYETRVAPIVEELRSIQHNLRELEIKRERLQEKANVYRAVAKILTREDIAVARQAVEYRVSDEWVELGQSVAPKSDPNEQPDFDYLVGTIMTNKFAAFERSIFRFLRGNYLMKQQQREMDSSERLADWQLKTIFVIFFMGANNRDKLLKICRGYNVELIDCPPAYVQRMELEKDTLQALDDVETVMQAVRDRRNDLLDSLKPEWNIIKLNTQKIMAIYNELNKMERSNNFAERESMIQPSLSAMPSDVSLNSGGSLGSPSDYPKSTKYLTCVCWIPTQHIKSVRRELMNIAQDKASYANFPGLVRRKQRTAIDTPPTHFTLNNFTSGFQNLINAYGLANYRELNPAPYTVITFPFLFAVMYGDIGHGLIMALFAVGLIVKKNKDDRKDVPVKRSEISNIIFGGRYIILLMGLFSIYTGFIYNDVFAKPFNIFGSSWYVDKTMWTAKKPVQLDPQSSENYKGTPYWFGMDPIWAISGDSAIIEFNSVKMKMAIILGVVHMMFGLSLSAVNQIRLRHYADLFMVTLPQFCFLTLLFFYLGVLVFMKWIMYGGHKDTPYNTACAPSVLIMFINMFLLKDNVSEFEGCHQNMYENQKQVELILLLLALACVPLLLVCKPLYILINRHRSRRAKDQMTRKRLIMNTKSNARRSLMYQVEDFTPRRSDTGIQHEQEQEEEYGMMELWIHSGIHCIDSVLGSVSHTASYLRLWALSLAHAQLSHVLWNMVLSRGFGNAYYYSVILFFIFSAWAVLTIAILVTMEALSAFLHTLRLHWVEFQSKFYEGAGEPFRPFQFEKL